MAIGHCRISEIVHCAEMDDSEKTDAILHSLHEKNQTNRDAALLALGSATLGFTITIFTTVYKGHALEFVIATWVCLVFSIICLLSSYDTAASVADKILSHGQAIKKEDVKRANHLLNRIEYYRRLTKRLNRWAVQSYVLALVSFVVFAISNVIASNVESKLPERHIEIQENLEKGALPARAIMPTSPATQEPVPASQPTSPPPAASEGEN